MRKRLAIWLSAAVTLALAGSASAQNVTDITTDTTGGGVVVTVRGNGLTQPKTQLINGGTTALIEFRGTWAYGTKTFALNTNGIGTVRISQFTIRPSVVRIAVALKSPSKPTATQITTGWTISFGATAAKRASGMDDSDAMAKALSELGQPAVTWTPKLPVTEITEPEPTTPEPKNINSQSVNVETAGAKQTISEPKTNPSNLTVVNTQPTDANSNDQKGQKAKQKEEPFPEKVPPLVPLRNTTNWNPKADKSDQTKVNLDFANTDVVIIIKALAEQTGSNIVTAPDVSGQLNISLKNVTVEQALDLTTKLSGYRYAKIGNTYVVGTSSFLTKVLLQDPSTGSVGIVTKVVPLASRKAGEIKRAVIRALSIDVLNESIKIVHPQETGVDDAIPASAGGTMPAGTGPTPPLNPGGNPPTDPNQQPVQAPQGNQGGAGQAPKNDPGLGTEGDADYLILIGDQSRVDQAKLLITQLDTALAEINGLHMGGVNADMRPITMSYMVRGGKAEDLAAAIKAFAGPVSVVATPKTSRAGQMVVLQGRPAEVERVFLMLNEIDNVDASGELVYHVYSVKFSDPRALRDRLLNAFDTLNVAVGPEGVTGLSYKPDTGQGGAPAAGGGTAGGSTQNASGTGVETLVGTPIFGSLEGNSVPMKLLITGPKAKVQDALVLLSSIDRPVPILAIEARVCELSKDDVVKAGLNWDLFSGGALKFLKLNNSQTDPANSGKLEFNSPIFDGSVTASLDRIIGNNKLIARPNVMATDGRESVVFIGDKVRYVKNIQSGQNGSTIEVGEEEVGVKLNVLPRVGDNNVINLEIQPTVSFIKSFLDIPNGGKLPQTSVRTARTTIRMMNGETIAIGGLITQQDRRDVQGVPLLMDIPIIGQLFRKTTNTKVKSEVCIFITVRVIDGDAASGANNVLPIKHDPEPKKSGG